MGKKKIDRAMVYDVGNKEPDYDCGTCIHRKEGCERAAENSFCTRWQGQKPEEKGPDPNEQWLRGEDVAF